MSCNRCATQAGAALAAAGVPSGQTQAVWALVHEHLPRCERCGRFLSPRNPVCANPRCRLAGRQQGAPRPWPPAGVRFTSDARKTGPVVPAPEGESRPGQAGAALESRMPQTAPPPPDRVLSDVAALSSGTLATLTGLRRYDELDRVQAAWVEFTQARPGRFENWTEAWQAFVVSEEAPPFPARRQALFEKTFTELDSNSYGKLAHGLAAVLNAHGYDDVTGRELAGHFHNVTVSLVNLCQDGDGNPALPPDGVDKLARYWVNNLGWMAPAGDRMPYDAEKVARGEIANSYTWRSGRIDGRTLAGWEQQARQAVKRARTRRGGGASGKRPPKYRAFLDEKADHVAGRLREQARRAISEQRREIFQRRVPGAEREDETARAFVRGWRRAIHVTRAFQATFGVEGERAEALIARWERWSQAVESGIARRRQTVEDVARAYPLQPRDKLAVWSQMLDDRERPYSPGDLMSMGPGMTREEAERLLAAFQRRGWVYRDESGAYHLEQHDATRTYTADDFRDRRPSPDPERLDEIVTASVRGHAYLWDLWEAALRKEGQTITRERTWL